MTDAKQAAREGARMHAFYSGYWARKRGEGQNPHVAGSELYTCWQNGWEYAREASNGPAFQ